MPQPTLRALTWNLFHGRSLPPSGCSLRDEFASRIAAWSWDVALLQEAPPWWARALAQRCDATYARALTSRNWVLPLQRPAAERFPDVLRSAGGGANVILVRGRCGGHRRKLLCRWPERRVVHVVRLDTGIWVANLHASVRRPLRASREHARAGGALLRWAGPAPALLGGDFNTRRPAVAGFERVAGHGVDHVLARGFRAAEPGEVLDRGTLSDHAPVAVTLVRG